MVYELIKPELRSENQQCLTCKNRVDGNDCAIERAVLCGGIIFPTELTYKAFCNQCEDRNETELWEKKGTRMNYTRLQICQIKLSDKVAVWTCRAANRLRTVGNAVSRWLYPLKGKG